MQIGGGPPVFNMSTAPGVHQESLKMHSRFDDPGNAMTHTQLIDTMLDRVPCFTRTDGDSATAPLTYEQQQQALHTGTFALTCYPKHVSSLGQSTVRSDVTPIIAMSMWNVLSRHNFETKTAADGTKTHEVKYDVNFAGSVRDNQPAAWANQRGKPLRSVSTHVGGMVGGEVSDAIVRAVPDSPIFAGSFLYHIHAKAVKVKGNDEPVDIHAVFVDNGEMHKEEKDVDYEKLIEQMKLINFNSDGSCSLSEKSETSPPVFWGSFGKEFCLAVRKGFKEWKETGNTETIKVTQIGRVGRAAWASSSEPSNNAHIALSHFCTSFVPHKGTLDVLYCDA